MPELDLVIPVFHEGANIGGVLDALLDGLTTPFRVLICYDLDEDDTLPACEAHPRRGELDITYVKNPSRGPHAAVCEGLRVSTAPAVLVYPADDDYNAGMLDRMVEAHRKGADIVCASRFIPGGSMVDCPWLKATLLRTAAFTLYHLAGLPTRDPTNGFRLFSRRVVDELLIESTEGFTYSLELLVKVHRLGWRVAEVPARWFERTAGQSRFKVLGWVPAYLRWYRYAFATRLFGRGPETVPRRPAADLSAKPAA